MIYEKYIDSVLNILYIQYRLKEYAKIYIYISFKNLNVIFIFCSHIIILRSND